MRKSTWIQHIIELRKPNDVVVRTARNQLSLKRCGKWMMPAVCNILAINLQSNFSISSIPNSSLSQASSQHTPTSRLSHLSRQTCVTNFAKNDVRYDIELEKKQQRQGDELARARVKNSALDFSSSLMQFVISLRSSTYIFRATTTRFKSPFPHDERTMTMTRKYSAQQHRNEIFTCHNLKTNVIIYLPLTAWARIFCDIALFWES